MQEVGNLAWERGVYIVPNLAWRCLTCELLVEKTDLHPGLCVGYWLVFITHVLQSVAFITDINLWSTESFEVVYNTILQSLFIILHWSCSTSL